jgi:Xaa-Pro aminopeptidase
MELKGEGINVIPQQGMFFPERARKSPQEVKAIEEAQQATEGALKVGLQLLRAGPTTSEHVRAAIEEHLFKKGYEARGTIVASGAQAADPHEVGSGPIQQGVPIVIDIFPRSKTTRYWGDLSRTVCLGSVPPPVQKMYDTVLAAQELAFSMLRPGVQGSDIQHKVEEFFVQKGYPATHDDTPRGFIHGVGHSVGLDIHESPAISRSGGRLEEGNVLTVEPGLYYPEGSVRIEDVVVITKDGFRNLTRASKQCRLN